MLPKICICGWYYDPRLCEALKLSGLDVTIISDPVRAEEMREQRKPYQCDRITEVIRESRGLEWGRYDYFLKSVWDRESPVIFMHDDIIITLPQTLHEISKYKGDQAFVFHSETEAKENQRIHGRGIVCSARFLRWLTTCVCDCKQARDHFDTHNPKSILNGTGTHTGFWFDPANETHASGKPPVGIRHYNEGIYHFATIAGRAPNMRTRETIISPDFVHARRGCYLDSRGTWREPIKYGGVDA